MSIDTTKKVVSIKVDGVSMPMDSGGGSTIVAAELPNNVLKLYSGATLLDTKTITTAPVEFSVSENGTYTVKAYDTSNNELWTKDVVVDEIGVYTCKSGKALTNYTKEEIHTLLQNGLVSTMFSYGDKWKFVQSGSLFNNLDFFVEKITKSNGKEIVDFRAVAGASSTYNIFPQMSYITSSSASSWTKTRYSYGGYKYSAMRQRMMKQGEDVYSQASGILPDDYSGSLTTGVKFSELKYTNGNSCSIYEYSSSDDTMTLLQSCRMSAPSNTGMMFIKGYFKSVGAIDETTFNAGVYYIYDSTNLVYTKATTFASGTTYYGLYETMQEDGIFVNALSSLSDYLVRFEDYSSAGGTQTSKVTQTNDYVDIPALEEITGINRTKTLFSGAAATNIGAYNLANEGTKKPAYDAFDKQAIGYDYWTRSAYSFNYNYFCCINGFGCIYNSIVNYSFRARIGFRLQ